MTDKYDDAIESLYSNIKTLAKQIAGRKKDLIDDLIGCGNLALVQFAEAWKGRGDYCALAIGVARFAMKSHLRSLDPLPRGARKAGRVSEVYDQRLDWLYPNSGAVQPNVERCAMIYEALDKLTPKDRAVIESRLFQGYTNEEIAGQTGEEANTISQRYRRALTRLKMLIAGE